MLNKILLALGVVVTISALGSALTCNVCAYTSASPKAQQMCNSSKTINCTTGYCYTVTYTASDGTVFVARRCANLPPNNNECPNAEETCAARTKQYSLKACNAACCKSDNCNNYTPSSATGVMAAKFTLCVMVIAGFLFV